MELEKYGIHGNMRFHEKVSILEDDKDFWRGFMDGNGRFSEISKRQHLKLIVITRKLITINANLWC